MTEKDFIEYINKLPLKIDEKKLELINIYYNFLIDYNKNVNLTAIVDKNEALLKHYYDSLTPTLVLNFNEINSILDIGTGAGFPGVVLKIFFPHLKLTLLDSNHKKTDFLEKLISKLKLNDVKIICQRSELYAKNNNDQFDLVIARAVKNLDILLEISLPMVNINGYFIAMKGKLEKELEENLNVIELLGGKIKNKFDLFLPIDNSKRTLLLIKKTSTTPKCYPREYSQITKKALKIILK